LAVTLTRRKRSAVPENGLEIPASTGNSVVVK